MRASELAAIVRVRAFRRLYATRLTSQLTDGVFQVALAGYVFFSPERQASAGQAAAAFAVTLLPYSALGPFAGVLIDRWARRRILVWAPVVRALLVLSVTVLVASGDDGAVFFAAVLIVLGVNRFFLAALSASLPHVVDAPRLVTANAFTVTSGTIAAFAGAGIGYGLRAVVGGGAEGTAVILLATAALFLAAGAIATRLPDLGPDDAPRAAVRDVAHGLADGVRYLASHRQGAFALAAIGYHRLLYGVVLMMTLLLCRNHFTGGDADAGMTTFAAMLGFSGAGFFVAALITPWAVERVGKRAWITINLAAGAGALALFATPFTRLPWAVGAFALGVVSQGVKLSVDTILQQSITDAYRGRVFALYDMLFNALFAAGAAASAALLPPDGVSPLTLAALVTAYAAGALAYRTATRPVPVA
ncbi:MFS transporter [Actinomadura flavalba]|uniref:MFS transporter n=1 Tax=Actinomadura flavalba TaxID=1120938 RepID=UPI00037A1CB3|nr:MFS transporter [Actinomadura flavalba]